MLPYFQRGPSAGLGVIKISNVGRGWSRQPLLTGKIMTQEQKAQAYDEALGWMRELYPGLHGATKEDAEHFFPELTESEDERIRKFLIQHISEWIGCIEHDLKHSSKDIESEKELAMFKAGLAYLEKQKESLPISETCKENANSFTDGIIEVRSFQRGMEEGRKLEKQNEQKPVPFSCGHENDKPLDNWKPSEEQMSYLLSLHQGGEEQKPLRELIEQLKKLM